MAHPQARCNANVHTRGHPIASRRTLLAGALAGAVVAPAAWLAGCAPAPPAAAPPAPGGPAAAGGPQPPWTHQPVFTLIRFDIRDAKGFGEYIVGHTPTVAAVGGRFIAAGAMPESFEGAWPARRMVIQQWLSAQVFLDWYKGAAYAPWKRMRQAATQTDMLLVQGLAPSVPSAEVAPAFVLVEDEVRDSAAYSRHEQGHLGWLRASDGEVLVSGGRVEVIEGDWKPARLTMQRWPSHAAFVRWYTSPENRRWREMRQSAARTKMALVAGLSEKTKIERRMP